MVRIFANVKGPKAIMKYIYYILLTAIGIALGMLINRTFFAPERIVETQTDTIVVRDTHIVEKPVYISRKVTDTMLVAVRDTLRERDTLYVAIPKEVKVYANEDYYAEVSGYQPNLDYLEIYQKNVVISKKEIPKVKKNYIAVGMEAGWCQTFSAPVYLEYSRKLHRNVEINAGVFRDLVIQETGFRVGVNANIGW